jgi:hypothetical protein
MSIFGIVASLTGKILCGSMSPFPETIKSAIDTVYKIEGEKLEKDELISRLDNELKEKQLDLSQEFISNKNYLMSGWWGLLAWTCSLTLVYSFLLKPILTGIFGDHFPNVDSSDAQNIIYVLLGMGTLKTSKLISDAILKGKKNAG